MTRAIMETDKGTINLELFDADAPNTVKNFVDLAEKGFYD
ncbi:peptidylprolyl isomerase, partial [Microcoleus sp. HI-ES]|nr:peptidylprolyl isomerase [Microcoleus sp. HI-ES]